MYVYTNNIMEHNTQVKIYVHVHVMFRECCDIMHIWYVLSSNKYTHARLSDMYILEWKTAQETHAKMCGHS